MQTFQSIGDLSRYHRELFVQSRISLSEVTRIRLCLQQMRVLTNRSERSNGQEPHAEDIHICRFSNFDTTAKKPSKCIPICLHSWEADLCPKIRTFQEDFSKIQKSTKFRNKPIALRQSIFLKLVRSKKITEIYAYSVPRSNNKREIDNIKFVEIQLYSTLRLSLFKARRA